HILSLRSQLDIQDLQARQAILAHYHGLKKDTLKAMITTGSAPYLIKKRALKLLTAEEAFQEKKDEYYALQSTFLKVSALHDMKALVQQRLFSKEEQELSALLQTHELLLDEIAACEARSKVWQTELRETKNSLMLSHKHLEELQQAF